MNQWLKVKIPKKLDENKLPSKLDIIRGFLFEKDLTGRNKVSIADVADIITEKIENIYLNAGIETIRKDKIKETVIKCYNSRLLLLKTSRLKRYDEKFLIKRDTYLASLKSLLHVSKAVTEAKEREEPGAVHNALPSVINLVKERKLVTESNTDCNCRKKRKAASLGRQKCQSLITMDSDSEESVDTRVDVNFEPTQKPPSLYTKRMDLSEIIEVKSRFSYSARGASALINATLRTFKIPTVIDKSKILRAEKRKFSDIETEVASFGGGLYYDGRKDLAIKRSVKRDRCGKLKYYRRIVREEHYTFISEPGGIFLGYIPLEKDMEAKPKIKAAEHCANKIFSFVKKMNLETDIKVIGCDGTNFNVGGVGGINHFIEVKLKRPIHWFICLLHANELPFRSLITKLDGPTDGAKSFSGPIGKALEDVHDLKIVKFKKMNDTELLKIPDEVYKKLSNDQRYLYRIVNAVISGELSEDLAQLKVGELNHSRWLTTASRCCRLYVSTKNPSDTLKILVSYIVKVYAPTWFRIKKKELAINGPKNFFFLLKKIQLITDDNAKLIAQKCVQRNSFFAHSENVLLAQLTSKRQSVRVDAVRTILKIREKTNNTIRIFTVPKINFNATVWTDIASQDISDMTEPPFTLNMSRTELMQLIEKPLVVPKFKCHTQMVERAVKEVTRVSVKAIDHGTRNAMVKATLMNRAKYPKLDSRQDFYQN